MKVAILGHNPVGLELALFFDQLGASVVWMGQPDDLKKFESFCRTGYDFSLLTGEVGLSILNSKSSYYSFGEYQEKYFIPLVKTLAQKQEIKSVEIESVNKRYLRPEEEVQGRSRFFDLFRVRYTIDPKDFVADQKEANPEVYERLTAEMMQSLQNKVEMYIDVDIVVNALERRLPKSLGTNGAALGETRLQSDKIVYGEDVYAQIQGITEDNEIREVVIIGSGEQAALAVSDLHPWLVKTSNARIFVATAESDPFLHLKTQSPDLYVKMDKVFEQQEAEMKVETDIFLTKLREWQGLDDFIQAKKPKPIEPIPRLVFFSGHSVTAVDQLIDKKRLFLTLETPEFRVGLKQSENNQIDLKTIGADKILVLAGSKRKNIDSTLRPDEKGYFRIEMPSVWDKNRKTILKNIVEKTEYEISLLFSPSGTH